MNFSSTSTDETCKEQMILNWIILDKIIWIVNNEKLLGTVKDTKDL